MQWRLVGCDVQAVALPGRLLKVEPPGNGLGLAGIRRGAVQRASNDPRGAVGQGPVLQDVAGGERVGRAFGAQRDVLDVGSAEVGDLGADDLGDQVVRDGRRAVGCDRNDAAVRRLITFSLTGDAAMPPQPPPWVPQPIEADFEVDADLAKAGNQLFNRDSIEGICWYCHGMGAMSGGMAPDLRASAAVLDAEAFERIVRGGALTAAGMPAFGDLTDTEIQALRHYIRREAEAALAQ